jgi:ACS family hexuronate transporter-like MFS transporter
MDPQRPDNKGRGFSWLIAILLMLALFVNYIDRQTLSVLVRFLPGELKMDNIAYGRIQALFLLAYGLSMPFAGWLIDRLGTRLGLSITVAVWSVIEFLHGTAHNVRTLGTYRFLLGIPEAAGLPAVSKAAAEHAAPHGRATLIGIAMFGLGMGSTLAPPVAAYLTLHFGWQWAFYGTGVAGFVWVMIWLLFYRPPKQDTEAPRPREAHVPYSHLLRDSRVVGLTIARIFSDSTWWIYLFWVPPFLVQTRHLDLHDMGVIGWIPYFFASIGSVAGGYASGYLVRQGWEPLRARRTIMWVCAAIVPFTSLVVLATSVAAVIATLAIATFFIQGFFANIFTLPADLFPREKVASVFGLNTMSGTLAGFFTIQLAGYIVERYSYTPVFVLVAFLLPIAALLTQWLVSPESAVRGQLAPQRGHA